METQEREQAQADADSVQLLGASWFEWIDDIKREELGDLVKVYSFNLGYDDRFVVSVYQHGAEGYFSRTGTKKLFKNTGTAFQIARLMKQREHIANMAWGI